MEKQTELSGITDNLVANYERDERGLVKGVQYKFKPNGKIDWRAMINTQWLVINRQFENKLQEKYGRGSADLKVEEVDDNFLLITLPGIKELADLRGIVSYCPKVEYGPLGQVSVTAQITWIENFETKGRCVPFGGVANASQENTTGFGSIYLEAIAENRAFVRAVRNFLGINIVGQDEIKPEKAQPATVSAASIASHNSASSFLQKTAAEKFNTFEKFKVWAETKIPAFEVSEWTGYGDIKSQTALQLLALLKE